MYTQCYRQANVGPRVNKVRGIRLSLLCCSCLLESGTTIVASLPWKWCLTRPFLKGSANKAFPTNVFCQAGGTQWTSANHLSQKHVPWDSLCSLSTRDVWSWVRRKKFWQPFRACSLQKRVPFLFWLIQSVIIDSGAFQRPLPLRSMAMIAFLLPAPRKAKFSKVIWGLQSCWRFAAAHPLEKPGVGTFSETSSLENQRSSKFLLPGRITVLPKCSQGVLLLSVRKKACDA